MEHLWAPWRKAYLEQGQPLDPDLFCRIAAQSDDEKNYVLLRGKSCFCLLNAFPYNTAHCLIVPYRKASRLQELSDAEILESIGMICHLIDAIDATLHPDGYNVGLNLGAAAGAGLESHLHWHLVPRWANDSNFMTTVGRTRVHPDDLPGVYHRLKSWLESAGPWTGAYGSGGSREEKGTLQDPDKTAR
ncbi:HIT family protein [Candidatus Methylacidithermus pantelleriae]|uniref:ATP adenylyltransferase n=1 Tax=Candidatus Methylacidithermus pantelleriae TaxID=2744239 RepID=A0A8J2BQI2_9BACT|nr:HIT domain-containing protein [Candidatus Methylacidithermus pantelleriae]CAF0703735.1 ATP adenylyltransferase [Candidatus Methylacidithermus pantelleriae]